MNYLKSITRLTIVFLVFVLTNCDESIDPANFGPGDGKNEDNIPGVNLEQGQLNDFKLAEVDYINIDIIQPVLTDGVESTQGEIKITIAEAHAKTLLSLSGVNFDTEKFSVSPTIGDKILSSSSPAVYKITSLEDSEKSIHYNVSIVLEEEEDATPESPRVTSFKFEKAKNPYLPQDIEALRIVTYPSSVSFDYIYVVVPNGTDISALVPTVTYEGGELSYQQGMSNRTKVPFPTDTDLKIDFRTSFIKTSSANQNEFWLSVKKSEDKVMTYAVIVAYENPIVFDKSSVTTEPVIVNGSRTFLKLIPFTNVGNYPISLGLIADRFVDNTARMGNIYTGVALTASDVSAQSYSISPGEKGWVWLEVDAHGKVPGDYDVDAIFVPHFDPFGDRISDNIEDDASDTKPKEDLYKEAILTLKTTVVDY